MIITYTHRDGLYVNMTNRCSNRCDFCVRNHGDALYGDLWLEREPSVDEIYADIEEHDLSHFSELVFCGYGEPTERLADMLDICRRIRKISDIRIRINTNGQSELINGKNSTPLWNGLFDIVSISLNAADADTYDRICHSRYGKAAYPAILAFAANVKPYVGHVIFSVVDTPIPPKDIEKCRVVADAIGVELRLREWI